MPAHLYLIETRAREEYTCTACHRKIPRGRLHFRHDPFPAARIHRGQKTTHWCRDCITAAHPDPKDTITGRIRIPVVRVVIRPSSNDETTLSETDLHDLPLFNPAHVELIGVGRILSERLAAEPSLIYQLRPEELEMLLCDRLHAMGFEPQRVGPTTRKDGGMDILFWPRSRSAFPFLGAAQVKHHRNPKTTVGSPTVREFAGTLAGHPINVGLLVTNTSFSPDAKWFAHERAKLLRLREFTDIRRWLLNNFSDDAEWREIPSTIELCPGVIVNIRR